MKKASTWYLFALAVLNLLIAFATSIVTKIWKAEYREDGGVPPIWTQLTLEFYWWPYLFIGFAITLMLISIFSSWPNRAFYHILICTLFTECFILLSSQIGLALPLIRMWSNVPDLQYPK
jgi:uncharacterized BrkB/YihY/UPF0761 family membrane protein